MLSQLKTKASLNYEDDENECVYSIVWGNCWSQFYSLAYLRNKLNLIKKFEILLCTKLF